MNFKKYLVTLGLALICYVDMGLMAQTVKRGPYLQLSTPTSTIIRWRTDVTTQSKVWYGTNASNLTQTASSSGTTKEHEVHIENLNPATIYHYKIGDNSGPYAPLHGSQYFKTHPAGDATDQPIRVWMLGNAGTKTNEQRAVRDAYFAIVSEQHIDMMLLTGDNAYDDGKDSEYQEAWFEDMYEARLVNSVMWSCFGNHDGGDADSPDESGTYYEIFNFPRNGEAGGVPSGTEAYYSFDYGNMHVISLNTVDVGREPGDPMIDWLEEDLAANEKKWQVVILHHRPYTGSNGNDSDQDEKPTDVRKYMLPRLEAAGVDLVLSSHSHNYQRSFLINGHYGKSNTFDENEMGVDMGDGQPDGDGAYSKVNSDIGTVYVVAGTAGQDDTGADELNHPVMHYNSGSAGSVQLLVSDTELVFQFINESEEIEDYFTIEKTPSIPVSGFKITNPTEGAAFAPQQNITITADTTGSLFDVSHVEFFVNNSSIGTVSSFPFYQPWTIPGAGEFEIKAVAHEQGGSETAISIVHITAGSSVVCASISSGIDDAEERESGSVNLGSGDLELGEDSNLQQVGMRFQNLNIPGGVTIDSAFIQFTVDETKDLDPCLLHIYGEKSTNPASYNNTYFSISSRPKTNASVNWVPDSWDFVNESTNAQRTPDLAALIQELITQPGYNDAQALAFIINGVGRRVAESFDGDANKAAELCIYYTPDFCSDQDNDGICDDNDPCPNGPEPGFACDDGNSGTYDDTIDGECNCVGIPFECPILQTAIGSPCNDNNSGTYDDVITADCNCEGTPYDCPTLQVAFGTPCNDNNNVTYNDVITTDCICAGTAYDCPFLLADIGSPCNDGNPNTSNDVIDEDCNCTGSLFDCPALDANIGDACDDANPLTVNDVVTANCICAGTLLQEEVIVVQVSDGSDDAEQYEGGFLSLGSSDLELITDDDNQIVGIRFLNTGIPEGASIADAYIQFTADETKVIDPCVLTITGEAADQPQTFVNQQFNISSRPRTNASVSWQPALWENIGDDGPAQRTADLTSIVQELINRPGYSSGSPLAFIIEGQGKRVAESYDGSAAKAPKLVVSYVFNCEDDDNDGVCNGQDVCANAPEPGTPCNDNNATTYDDVIDGNCNCTGTSFDCPGLLANVGDACDDANPLTINDAINGNCECEGLAPGTEITVCSRVIAPEDDAEERADGSVKMNSGDIELVFDANSQIVGFRFLDLNIPQGALIQEANIQFMVDETKNIDPCQIFIFAEAADNPASFASVDFNISDRVRTNAAIAWSPPLWTVKGAAGANERTSDISAVLQEVVNRAGFSENSPVVIMMNGNGKRVSEAYEGGADRAAELCVTFSMSIPPQSMEMPGNGDILLQTDETLENGGGDIRDEKVVNDTEIKDLKVYPNPTKDQLNLAFYSHVASETQVQVQDVNGQLLSMQAYQTTKGNNLVSITNLDLPNGVYVVRLNNGGVWQSRKFVVLK